MILYWSGKPHIFLMLNRGIFIIFHNCQNYNFSPGLKIQNFIFWIILLLFETVSHLIPHQMAWVHSKLIQVSHLLRHYHSKQTLLLHGRYEPVESNPQLIYPFTFINPHSHFHSCLSPSTSKTQDFHIYNESEGLFCVHL